MRQITLTTRKGRDVLKTVVTIEGHLDSELDNILRQLFIRAPRPNTKWFVRDIQTTERLLDHGGE